MLAGRIEAASEWRYRVASVVRDGESFQRVGQLVDARVVRAALGDVETLARRACRRALLRARVWRCLQRRAAAQLQSLKCLKFVFFFLLFCLSSINDYRRSKKNKSLCERQTTSLLLLF